MHLTEHFTLQEFVRSQRASRMGIDNTPGSVEIEHARQLCVHILEPVRRHYLLPVDILSGMRMPALNSMTPGASSVSQHTTGEAADIAVRWVPHHLVARWMVDACLPFDQLILEYAHPERPSEGWVHVSYGIRHRRQVLTTDNEGTLDGLPAWALK